MLVAIRLVGAFAGLRVARRTADPFARYMAAGITLWSPAAANW